MDTTMDLKIGQVVKSKAGRDKGKVFAIVEIVDDKNVLIIDGDIRKISSPKLKKIKHLIVYKTVVEEFAEIVKNKKKYNDAYVRKLLEPFYIDKH